MNLRTLVATSVLALTAVSQLAAAPSPTAVAESEPWISTASIHPIAGRVTIEAPAGLSGIRLDTAAQVVRPVGEELVVDRFDGAAAFVVGVEDDGPGHLDPREMSIADWHTISADFERLEDGTAYGNGAGHPRTTCHRSDDPAVYGVPWPADSPYLDYYVATDEPITFTLTFADEDLETLPGHVTYTPDGTIDGELVNMTGTCPTGDCSHTRFGGVSRSDFGYDEAFGTVVTLTYARESLQRMPTGHRAATTTRTAVASCIYPSILHPENSPRAEDHPLGCTIGAGVSPTTLEPQSDPYGLYVVDDSGTGKGVAQSTIWPGVHGEQYVGFHLRNWQMVDQFGEGSTGQWAFWVNPGIH